MPFRLSRKKSKKNESESTAEAEPQPQPKEGTDQPAQEDAGNAANTPEDQPTPAGEDASKEAKLTDESPANGENKATSADETADSPKIDTPDATGEPESAPTTDSAAEKEQPAELTSVEDDSKKEDLEETAPPDGPSETPQQPPPTGQEEAAAVPSSDAVNGDTAVAAATLDSFDSTSPVVSPTNVDRGLTDGAQATEAPMEPSTFDDMSCVACKKPVVEPRLLPCLHSMCRTCVKTGSTQAGGSILFAEQMSADQSYVLCPACNEAFPIPVGGFPENSYLIRKITKRDLRNKFGNAPKYDCEMCDKKVIAEYYCDDCGDFLCPECSSFHRTFKATKGHTINDLSVISLEESIDMKSKGMQKVAKCPEHNEPFTLYCEQCNTVICSVCLTESHTAHPTAVIDDKLATKQSSQLKDALQDILAHTRSLEPMAASRDELVEDIRSELQSARQGITQLTEVLKDILIDRRDALNNEALQIANRKLQPIVKEREVITKIMALYKYLNQHVEAVLKDGTPGDIAMTKSTLLLRRKKLSEDHEACSLPPTESTAITLRTSGNIDAVTNALAGVGYVCGGSDASKSSIVLSYSTLPAVSLVRGEDLVCEVVMKDIRGQTYLRGGEGVVGFLKMEGAGNEKVMGKVTDKKNGTYVIHFDSYQPGRNYLFVELFGMDVSNSPMELTLTVKDIQMIGTKSETIACPDSTGQYRSVALSEGGMFAVTDSEKRCVCLLTPKGEVKKTFGTKGARDGAFKHKMTGTAFDRDGHLYVTDDENGRVQKFRVEDGQVLNVFGEHAGKLGKMTRPRGVAIRPDDQKVYVSDFESHRILVFLPNGQFLNSFGKKGSGPGKLKSPLGIAFGPEGNLYVVDSGNNRIVVFSPDGEYLRSFGSKPNWLDLNQPWGIAVTAEGYVIVTERLANCVSIFQGNGEFVLQFGDKGTGELGFDQPCGVVASEGKVYVADAINARIQTFTYIHA